MSSPSDEDQVLVASRPLAPDAESMALADVYDVLCPLSSAALTGSSNGECNDFASRGVPTLGMQPKTGLVRLHPVTALVAEPVIASDVVSLKNRITAVEATDNDNMKARDDIGVRAEAVRKIALFRSGCEGSPNGVCSCKYRSTDGGTEMAESSAFPLCRSCPLANVTPTLGSRKTIPSTSCRCSKLSTRYSVSRHVHSFNFIR